MIDISSNRLSVKDILIASIDNRNIGDISDILYLGYITLFDYFLLNYILDYLQSIKVSSVKIF